MSMQINIFWGASYVYHIRFRALKIIIFSLDIGIDQVSLQCNKIIAYNIKQVIIICLAKF